MTSIQSQHTQMSMLKNLDSLSIENLACGRITRDAIRYAVQRAMIHSGFLVSDLGKGGQFSTYSDMLLADEINEMLQAAKDLDPFGDGRRSLEEGGKKHARLPSSSLGVD